MGRKKMTATEETTKATDDRHKAGFLVRIPAAYGPVLDSLVDDNPGSDRTEWVRTAVRQYLESKGLWPPRE